MEQKPIQDYYSDVASHCYGCGRLNDQGLHIKSYWEGDESVCVFEPWPQHTSFPGFVYGGLIAALIDCHSMGTAAAANYHAEGRPMDSDPPLRYVTASLHVDYLKPTPHTTLTVRGRATEIAGRKTIVTTSLYANGEECARGQVVAVRMPEHWIKEGEFKL